MPKGRREKALQSKHSRCSDSAEDDDRSRPEAISEPAHNWGGNHVSEARERQIGRECLSAPVELGSQWAEEQPESEEQASRSGNVADESGSDRSPPYNPLAAHRELRYMPSVGTRELTRISLGHRSRP